MAKLIPRIEIDEIENKPERDTARSLVEQLPEDAVVFHSYPWLRAERNSRGMKYIREGEADFVIVLWDLGLLVLEVKGGEIVFEPEYMEWYRVLPHRRKKIKDPFKQASSSLHVIKDKIQNEVFPGLRDLPLGYGYAVVFPDCDYSGDMPPGADHAVVLCAKDLPFFNRRIPEVIKSWRTAGRQLTDAESKKLIAALTSSFNLIPLLSRQIEEEYDKFVRLTYEQSQVLDFLGENDRCLIEGVAGSGKTILAMELARRFALLGKRTLLVCFNITLAKWLSESLMSEEERLIDVCHFHGLCEEMCEKANVDYFPEGDLGEFYNDIAPEKLLDAIDFLGTRYDAVVVDEGQDFQVSWWTPLELLCHEGAESPFFVFYDRAQNLFVENLVLPELGKPYFLNRNCRNTRRIADTCSNIMGIEIDLYDGTPEGRSVTVKVCSDSESQLSAARSMIKDLMKRGLKPNQIVVLSPYTHNNQKYSFFGINSINKIALTDSTDEWQKGRGILYATIKSFKGLEADAVILVDIPNPAGHRYFTVNDLYVGMSRAKHILTILTRDKFLDSMPLSEM